MSKVMPDFNAMVSIYERLAEPLTGEFCRQAIVASSIGGGDRIIDVATGTGALALRAAAIGARVLATDAAPPMVARTAERLAPFPDCGAEVMDATSLRALDDSFDAAFSVFGVTVLKAWRDGLAELVRVVRPGGKVVVGAWPDKAGARPMVMLSKVFGDVFPGGPAWGSGLNDWTRGSLRDALVASGCTDVAVSRHEAIQTAPSFTSLMDDLDPIFRFAPPYGTLTDEGRQRLSAPLKRAFQAYAQPNGSIVVPIPAFIAVGHKPR